METIKNLLLWILYMIPGFIAIGLVILIHEFGHFIASRLLGVYVEEFCVGMGPKIYKKKGKKTTFILALIPFGGHCKIGGSEDLQIALENNDKEIRMAEEGSFFAIHPLKKLIIYISGPLINFLLCFILLSISGFINVEHLSDRAIVAPISDYPTLFSMDIEQDKIHKGDLILSINNEDVIDYQDAERKLSLLKGKDALLKIERDGKIREEIISATLVDGHPYYGITNLIPPIIGRSDDDRITPGDILLSVNGIKVNYSLDLFLTESNSYTLLFQRGEDEYSVTLDSSPFPFAWKSDIRIYRMSNTPIRDGWNKTISFFITTSKAIGKLLSFQFNEALKEISGPFTSASKLGKISTEAFKTSMNSGIRSLIYLLGIVSISISVGNLIPIPTFDGGQIIVTIFELFKGKPLRPKTYVIVHILGLVVAWTIIILMNVWPIIMKIFA